VSNHRVRFRWWAGARCASLSHPALWSLVIAAWLATPSAQAADADEAKKLAEALKRLSPLVVPEADRKQATSIVREDQSRRLREANQRSSAEWSKIKSHREWTAFSAARIEALRQSLGQFPEPPTKLNLRVTGKLTGDGYEIHNLVFESRPGLWVTANLYLPQASGRREPADVSRSGTPRAISRLTPAARQSTPAARQSMPGILICHSHHRPKEHGELQDMGMTWARAGCLVLVMDQLGHGERRQHPFRTAADYAKPYAVSRQDYFFRYDTSIQLYLAGESLMGWMVWDLMRGVDLLLAQPGIDSSRIILLGAVAGGGDPAAVAGALDERIAAVVPFNFGGPQPETRYPLPEDIETSFNYAGSGSWESTRNLRLSAAEGFLPWVIVGSVAPRRLIYAHEFSWHRERDPVWKRLQTIYGSFYRGAGLDNLAFTHGRGELRGQPPEATHCTHIGREHRKMIHVALKKWFDISVTDAEEYSKRREERELLCMTAEAERELKPKKLHEVLSGLADERLAAARKNLEGKTAAQRRELLRAQWSRLLGPAATAEVPRPTRVASAPKGELVGAESYVRREVLDVGSETKIPLLYLGRKGNEKRSQPIVVAVAQAGKEAFLRHRTDELAELLLAGVDVCLVDVRGTGETASSDDRGRTSGDTSRSSTELMLGGTMLGARLRELRIVLKHVREQGDASEKKVFAMWGDSFADANPPSPNFHVPHNVDGRAKNSEPLGGLLALLAALYEDDVKCVFVRGGLGSFRSVLESQFVHIPHDIVVPGVLTIGDLPDVAGVLAPSAQRSVANVDGLNRRISDDGPTAAWLARGLRSSP
jgi:dienelactone hydrolase